VTTARLCGFWTDSVGGLLRTNTQASEAEDIKSSCDADRGPHESGNTIQVTQKNSTATIDFTNQTAIAEIDPAQLSDVTAGSCVAIRPTRAPNGPVTAVNGNTIA